MADGDILRFFMRNAMEIILFYDEKGTVLYANHAAEKHLEYDFEKEVCTMDDIFPEEAGKEACYRPCGEENSIQNVMLYRKNRTCFPGRALFLEYESDRGRVYSCMAYDASGMQMIEKMASQAKQEREEVQKVKSDFVANVTHELRTPVNGILGNTRELLTLETEKNKLQLLQMIERGCRDMNALINNILDFSKLEAGKFALEPQAFNFRTTMEYVENNYRYRMTEKGLEFTVSVKPGVPETIIGDELRIVQILNNLISNAYKFTSVGAVNVEVVKTAQSGNRAELFFMVIDSGIGMDQTDQEKLFKSFSQVDASISRKYGGTGLGLNITKQLVELMNGSIHVQSEKGKGTVFSFNIWVELPENCPQENESSAIEAGQYSEQNVLRKLMSLSENTANDKVWTYGSQENKEETGKKLSKLILCIEMDNWEKAEGFAETLKKLLEDAPREIKSTALRLKMSVQKGDYDKTLAAANLLREQIEAGPEGV